MSERLAVVNPVLGSGDPHVFEYEVASGKPEGWLSVMLVTPAPGGGQDFNLYRHEHISPGNTRFAIPPPPALPGNQPYLLFGVVTSDHQPDVPRDLIAFLDWFDAGSFPAAMSVASLTKEQVIGAREAALRWTTVLWNDDLDRRRSMDNDWAAQRLIGLLDHLFPEHRLHIEPARELLDFIMECDVTFKKRSADENETKCVACSLIATLLLTSSGLGLGWKLMTMRGINIDGEPAPLWVVLATNVWLYLAMAYGGRDLPNMTAVEKAWFLARGARAAYDTPRTVITKTWALGTWLCDEILDCRPPSA